MEMVDLGKTYYHSFSSCHNQIDAVRTDLITSCGVRLIAEEPVADDKISISWILNGHFSRLLRCAVTHHHLARFGSTEVLVRISILRNITFTPQKKLDIRRVRNVSKHSKFPSNLLAVNFKALEK
jgi:hypothetical protein